MGAGCEMEREEEARHRPDANRERKSGLDTAENAMMCVGGEGEGEDELEACKPGRDDRQIAAGCRPVLKIKVREIIQISEERYLQGMRLGEDEMPMFRPADVHERC